VIVGVGIDLISVARIATALARHPDRFAARVFTEGERAVCAGRGQPAQHFAARFAVKEATLKALGVPEGLSWHELEVVSDASGAPGLRLSGRAAAAAQRLGVTRSHLSLSHSDGMAIAVVVLEAGPASGAPS